MRIQELERLVDLDRATIRFYEKEGLITPLRSKNGYRDYSEEIAGELKKIRLLRQLGMSVFTIKQLQQGSADFTAALTQQITTLSSQIEEQKRARAVCQTMQDEGAQFESLNSDYYLDLLTKIQVNDFSSKSDDFQEKIPKEIHPWRRWFARTLDYMNLMTVIDFIITVVFRVRPLPGTFIEWLIAILAAGTFVPIEAYLLSKWGTTPGKFAMGIRLESINGGNLSRDEALRRSWGVYKEGTGFRIPFLEMICKLYRYLRLTGRSFWRFARKEDIPDPEDMLWDSETEIIYDRLTWKRGVVLASVLVFSISISAVTALDAIKPKYRGNELTIAQFSENYNHCLSIFNENADRSDMLQPDGTKYPVPDNTVIVDIWTGKEYVPQEFEYITEDGFLKSVTIHRHWDDVILYTTPLAGETIYLTYAIWLGQSEADLPSMMELAKLMDRSAMLTQGEIKFRNIIIQWEIRVDNYEIRDGVYYAINDTEEPSVLDLIYTVTIQ